MKQFTSDQVRKMLWDIMKDSEGKQTSQRELAKQIGVSVPFLNSTLKGHREPQGKILDFLGLETVVAYRYVKKRKAVNQ